MLHRAFLLLVILVATPPVQAAVVLQYHHISTETPASTSTSPEWFARHLNYLDEAGFDVVPLTELVEALRAGEPLPDKTAAITFDDGYLNNIERALPILEERGLPATVFMGTWTKKLFQCPMSRLVLPAMPACTALRPRKLQKTRSLALAGKLLII